MRRRNSCERRKLAIKTVMNLPLHGKGIMGTDMEIFQFCQGAVLSKHIYIDLIVDLDFMDF